MRRRLVIGAVVVLVLGLLAVRRGRRETDVGKTARAERGAIERVVVASGTIEPEHLVEVRAKVSGIVQRFAADAGDRVTAGQVVAELDRETLDAAVREAHAALREMEVQRDQAGIEQGRRATLFARGLDAKETLDRAATEHAAGEARVAHAHATLERLEQELAYATITAPIDGVVLERELTTGDAVASVATVTGGTVIMTIADTSQMHLKGVVDENDIARVAVGLDARIRTEAYPDRVFPGRVRKIAPIGTRKNNVTSFNVEVTVLDGIEALSPRMSADADVVAEVHPDAVVIPEAALVYDGDDVLVDVVERRSPARVARRKVKVGIANEQRVEITDGLAAGDEVKLQ
jgi:HlyD family secretion protein